MVIGFKFYKVTFGKQGVFFTLIAMMLLSLLFVSYSIYSFVDDRSAIELRINSMNNYITSLEEDLSRKVYITGFRIIFIYERRIAETGIYASDIDTTFVEAFFNGTIGGTVSEDEVTLLSDVLFKDIIEDINNDAASLNLEVNFTNPEISISQVDPWNVLVKLTGNLQITDLSGLASWNKSSEILSYISIENFDDPLYMINTNGLISRKFNKTIYSSFVDGSNVSNLTSHLEGRYYTNTSLAPSFLNRLEGNLSNSTYGIESLVYLPDLASEGFTLKDKSIVDHIYFSGNNPTSNGVSGMPSWFKIDNAHKDVYEIS